MQKKRGQVDVDRSRAAWRYYADLVETQSA
jgi:hypothetical protein